MHTKRGREAPPATSSNVELSRVESLFASIIVSLPARADKDDRMETVNKNRVELGHHHRFTYVRCAAAATHGRKLLGHANHPHELCLPPPTNVECELENFLLLRNATSFFCGFCFIQPTS